MLSALSPTARSSSNEVVDTSAERDGARFDDSGRFTKADLAPSVAELFRALDHVLARLEEIGCITSIGDVRLLENLARTYRQARRDVGSTDLDAG